MIVSSKPGLGPFSVLGFASSPQVYVGSSASSNNTKTCAYVCVGVYVSADGCLPLCGLAMNWRLVPGGHLTLTLREVGWMKTHSFSCAIIVYASGTPRITLQFSRAISENRPLPPEKETLVVV